MKKTKLKSKKNSKIKSIIMFVLIIIAVNTVFSSNKSYSKVKISYKSEFTSSGDTLWSIAQRESKNNKYYQDKDVRYIIYDLKQINNLISSELKEGQEIKIPKI